MTKDERLFTTMETMASYEVKRDYPYKGPMLL